MNKVSAEPQHQRRCNFSVWAPEKDSMTLHIVYPSELEISMNKDNSGYFSVAVEGISGGARYFYKPDGKNDYPDPASFYQPEGVNGPSEVVDHRNFCWHDHSWRGIPLKDLIMYELHVGTFTNEGTFEAIIPFLDEIAATGINALELMPVAQFPGSRNWGYDGVFPYSVQNSYGGPEGLKFLVDACHARGIAVFIDVVYNHIGPEGNIFEKFAPYFTGKYKVPWGDAVNFDDRWCDGVREYFAGNPQYWFINYHIDGIRADAIHMIYDTGAVHVWELTLKKLTIASQKAGRKFYMIAECDSNDPKVVKAPDNGGYGFDAQWLDDFHHSLYVMLHPEDKNRYEDFGQIEQLAKAYTDGFVHSGEFVKFRKRRHGASTMGFPGEKFVAFNQNHDQIGNRVKGERLSALVDFEHLKVAAAALLLSPYIPLLFMGEEYGEDNPFFYFISHSDKKLVNAVKEGRKKEFESYNRNADPPDPQDERTFVKSKIKWNKRFEGNYQTLLLWYKKLIQLRKTLPALRNMQKNDLRIYINPGGGLIIYRRSEDESQHVLCFFNFSDHELTFDTPSQSESWTKILDSGDNNWSKDGLTIESSSLSPYEIKALQVITVYPCSIVVYKGSGTP